MNNLKLDTTFHTQLEIMASTAAGFSASEVTGFSPEQVRRAAEALVKEGRLVRSKITPRRVRYFRDDKLALAYKANAVPAVRQLAALGPRSRATWAADEPAVITPRTKFTVAPPLPKRTLRTNTFTQF